MATRIGFQTKEEEAPRLLTFTGQADPRKVLEYLLAAQRRKRFLEPRGGVERKALGTLIVGDARQLTRHIELYFIRDADKALQGLKEFEEKDKGDGSIHALFDQCRRDKEPDPGTIWNKISYHDDPEPPPLSDQRYLMQVTARLSSPDGLDEFCALQQKVLKVFTDAGLTLFLAGWRKYRDKESKDVVDIFNVWTVRDFDDISQVMRRLADNSDYSKINDMTTQEQLVLRNIALDFRADILHAPPIQDRSSIPINMRHTLEQEATHE